MRYLYQWGTGAERRVMHLCGYDPYTGQPTMQPICGLQHHVQPPIGPAGVQTLPSGGVVVTEAPPDGCPCGGLIVWLDEGDYWDGSCYGQCGDYPRVPKLVSARGAE